MREKRVRERRVCNGIFSRLGTKFAKDLIGQFGEVLDLIDISSNLKIC